ncbi:TPA: helix-turn-helix domain-containing protein [Morganella morganii subsp. morganii]|nr:helix-turn-helix domain-containing protein [Morganella morganii subsp. morganii]
MRKTHNALTRRWPKGEKIIADFLNVSPAEIWPSRYMQKNILMIINKNPGSRGTARDPGTMYYVTPVSAGFWLH